MTMQLSRTAASGAPATSEIREWASERGLTARPGASPLLHIAALLAAWAGACALGFAAGTLWVWLPIWCFGGFVLMGCASAAHDCIHGTFARSRLGNTIAGHLLLLFVGGPFATYRQFHLFHHTHTLGEHDPEGPPADFTARWQYALYMVALGPGFLALIWANTITSAFGRPPAWARTAASRRVLRTAWFPTLPLLVALFYACTQSAAVRAVWMWPWVLLVCPVLPFVLLSEHYGGHRGDGLLANTYTIRSNRVTSFILFNVNHHTAHHLVPRVPSGRLHELDELLAPYEQRWARGYLAFHARLLRSLPWRTPRPTSSPEGPG